MEKGREEKGREEVESEGHTRTHQGPGGARNGGERERRKAGGKGAI